MTREFRKKHDMGSSALAFCEAHPASIPRFTEFVATLATAVTEGRKYLQQFGEGRAAARATVGHRQVTRAQMHVTMREITAIGQALASTRPELRRYFLLQQSGGSHVSRLSRGRQFAAKVAELQDEFTGFGFGPERLAAFTALLDAYEATLTRSSAARGAHVGASAEMDAIGTSLLATVAALDAINIVRFRDDPENLAAWKSASTVSWPEAKRGRTRPEGGSGAAA